MAKKPEWQIVEDSPISNMQVWYSERKGLYWSRSQEGSLPHVSLGMVPDFMTAIKKLGEYELSYGAVQ